MSNQFLRTLSVSNDVIAKIETIIDLPQYNEQNTQNWIVQEGSLPNKGLYILHNTDESDEDIAGFTRGLVVDVENGRVIRRTFGREPKTQLDSIPEKGTFELQGERGTIHKIGDRSRIVEGLDGVIVSFSYHNREVLIGTHKFIDISNTRSRRPMSKLTYIQQLLEYGGVNTAELFDFTKSYSPHVHYFMLAHEDLIVSSKMPYEFMGIYYLGVRRMWGTPINDELSPLSIHAGAGGTKFPSSPFAPGVVDNEPHTPTGIISPGQKRLSGEYFTLRTLTREQANDFLRTGYYVVKDAEQISRSQLPGEYIMIYQYDDAGQVNKAVRVNSSSYQHRHEILHPASGLEWNIERRFLQLINDAVGPHRIALMNDNGSGVRENIQHRPMMKFVQYPSIPYNELQSLVSEQKAAYYTEKLTNGEDVSKKEKAIVQSNEEAVYNLWLNMLYAAPVSHQPAAFELLTGYYEAIRVLTWYISFYQRDLSVLTQEGYGLLVSFIRMADKTDEIDLSNIVAVHAWVAENIFSIPGTLLYSNIVVARRAYNELVLERTLWLSSAVSIDGRKGLFTLEEAKEWITDVFQAEERPQEQVDTILSVFEEKVRNTSQLVSEINQIDSGVSSAEEINMALRVQLMNEDLASFLWFTESLDIVYEKGIHTLVAIYRDTISPDVFQMLAGSNPDLYNVFVRVQRSLEEALIEDKLHPGLISDKNAPELVKESMFTVFYHLAVGETTLIQSGLIQVSA